MDDNNPRPFIPDGSPDFMESSRTGVSIAMAIIESKKDIPIFYPERIEREEE